MRKKLEREITNKSENTGHQKHLAHRNTHIHTFKQDSEDETDKERCKSLVFQSVCKYIWHLITPSHTLKKERNIQREVGEQNELSMSSAVATCSNMVIFSITYIRSKHFYGAREVAFILLFLHHRNIITVNGTMRP